MEIHADTSVSEAVGLWKKKMIIRRTPNIIGVAILLTLTSYGWSSASWGTRLLAAFFALGFLADTIYVAWQERRDPALGAYDRGILKFYWISGRSAEFPVEKVRRVKAHENGYWQVRRVYPKWFELEVRGEPSKVIIPAFNLKPEAREVLERMSRQGATAG